MTVVLLASIVDAIVALFAVVGGAVTVIVGGAAVALVVVSRFECVDGIDTAV